MPSVNKKATTRAHSNVHTLNATPAKVLPPDGWVLEGPFGHMAFEAGEGGRLVRLADVLRWLQASREIPRTDALQVLCDGMPAEVMGWLYWVQPTAFAIPVPATHTFGFQTAEQIAAQRGRDGIAALNKARRESASGWGWGGTRPFHMAHGRITTKYPEATEPGLPALLKHLRGWWVLSKRLRGSTCDVLDDPAIKFATPLAIRLDKARELWGYGHPRIQTQVVDTTNTEPTTWAELVSFRKNHKGACWSVTQKSLVAAEKMRRAASPGAVGIAQAMAEHLDISVTALNEHIRTANEPGKRAGQQSKAA